MPRLSGGTADTIFALLHTFEGKLLNCSTKTQTHEVWESTSDVQIDGQRILVKPPSDFCHSCRGDQATPNNSALVYESVM